MHDSAQAEFTNNDPVSSAGQALAEAYRRNPLAADVRYWGNWMLEKAREELAEFYPPEPDGSVPVGYLWSRTIPCPNCDAEMPLIRQYWLARKEKKKVALEPVLDLENNRVDFKVVEGLNVTGDPAEATVSHGDARCLLCGQVVKAAQVHDAGRAEEMAARLTAVVLAASGKGGKRYRVPNHADLATLGTASLRVVELESKLLNDLPAIPDEPLAYHPQYMLVREYGLDQWGKLFNARQLFALTTFARLVGEAHAQMTRSGLDAEFAKAVATYLGLAVDRVADYNSTLTRWASNGEYVGNTFTRQALPIAWDFIETNPFSGATGDFIGALNWICSVVEHCSLTGCTCAGVATVGISDATTPPSNSFSNQAVVTDPPYYDAINYADLSDFFYVWLKRSIGDLHPNLLNLPLTPKRDQIVMNVYASNGANAEISRKEEARQKYVDGMAQAFRAMSESLEPDGLAGVVFAHTDPDAWGTLIEGLLAAGLIPDVSWPIDTELENKASGLGQARLKTSVWMCCRKRGDDAAEAFLGDVMEEMRPVIRDRLLYFWAKGIRGADFFISAIGPALSVFGSHSRVLRPDGGEVTVRDFLDIVRRESTAVALEQVLHGADLGVVDPLTRQYVTWVWSYSRAPLEAGEAIALCLATGAAYSDLAREHSIAAETREKSKKMVRLRTIRQRAMDDEDLGHGSPARSTPLIDQLQHAAWLWSQNQSDRLAVFRGGLGETRWTALQTLGQAVAECLPVGDEDRRIIQGMLGSSVMAAAPKPDGQSERAQRAGAVLPGFENIGLAKEV